MTPLFGRALHRPRVCYHSGFKPTRTINGRWALGFIPKLFILALLWLCCVFIMA
jgi:hypothetical protein